MKKILLASTLLISSMASGVHAQATPTPGTYNADGYGKSAPVLPTEWYTNQDTLNGAGYISLTCPGLTNQYAISTEDGSAFKYGANKQTCPTGKVTNGTACNNRPGLRYWDYANGQAWVLVKGTAGTTVDIACYKQGK